MNDFTKEELEDIYNCIDVYCWGSPVSKAVHELLMNKIQYMIDDYCDHEPEEWSKQLTFQKCKKCKVVYR